MKTPEEIANKIVTELYDAYPQLDEDKEILLYPIILKILQECTCPTCGSDVVVVGKTTMQYEPVKQDIKLPEKRLFPYNGSPNWNTIESNCKGWNECLNEIKRLNGIK